MSHLAIAEHDTAARTAEPRHRRQVAELVLLGGGIRPTPLSQLVRRAPFDLPLSQDRTILSYWKRHARSLCDAGLLTKPCLRVLMDSCYRRGAAAADVANPCKPSDVMVEWSTDPLPFRGTAGVLRDCVYETLPADDYIIVASAAQVLFEPPADLVKVLLDLRSDVAFVSNLDGVPVGLLVLRVGCLAVVPEIGYCDLKEQALPLIAKEGKVSVLHRRHAACLPVRSLPEYVAALQRFHGGGGVAGPSAEHAAPAFSLIETGGVVSPTAKLYDSVVLSGGTVGPGATLVRCVVCPGGRVKRGQTVVDATIGREPQK